MNGSQGMDSTQRFTHRVDAYQRARPPYPDAVVGHLRTAGALGADAPAATTVVDLGVGTGLSAEPFLRAGYAVVGVEPNAAMRAGGDAYLAGWPRYRSVDATAEATGLPASAARLVIAGQAFHWFDPARTRAEALRLLEPRGWAALLWNDRDTTSTTFLADYEALMCEFGERYREIRYRHEATDAIAAFFGGAAPMPAEFAHARALDWDALAALVGSSSYMPAEGDPRHAAMRAALRAVFERHRDGAGTITMRYTTRVHAAPLA